MKLTDIARYWAAKELTKIERQGSRYALAAPFACPGFTMRLPAAQGAETRPRLVAEKQAVALKKVGKRGQLESGCWLADGEQAVVCFDLPRGNTVLELAV